MAATKAIVCVFLVSVSLALVISQDTSTFGPRKTITQERLSPGIIAQLTRCNYTTEANRTCRSCTQALTCYRSNVGVIRNCRGRTPHCNKGRCSKTRSPDCANPSTTPASTTTTTESTTTESTTTESTTTESTTTEPTATTTEITTTTEAAG